MSKSSRRLSSRRLRAAVLGGAAAALTVSASVPAMAGAFGLREQSAVGQGMSFAGMAAGGGDSISGMFWNPAVLNQVEHFQGEQHITGVFPNSDVDITGGPLAGFGDGGDIGKNALLTSGYNAYRLTDQIAVGLSINTPFGLATDPKSNYGGQIYARSSRVRSVNAAPTIGYKVNEWFSVAAGVQIQWFDIRLRQAVGAGLGAALPSAPSATLRGDDFGVGFTAGATFTPTDTTSIGIGFRSMIKHKLDGKLQNPIGPDQNIKAKVKLPETVTVGIRQEFGDFAVLAGFEWTNWSRIGVVDVQGAGGLQLPFNYKDGYFYSGGAEYKFSPDLTLRAGVAYEKSPLRDSTRTLRLPDDDRYWFSAGGSYNYSERLSFDLGYSYIYVPGKSDITITAPVPLTAEAKSDVHIVSVALRYKIGAEAPAALVTKY